MENRLSRFGSGEGVGIMPKVKTSSKVPSQKMEGDAKGVSMQILLSPDDGAPNFAMRMFTVDPGGQTPFHAHSWEHEAFILEGEGVVGSDLAETPIEAGQAVFIAPNERHCFRNTGKSALRFLCIVPANK